MTGSATSTTIMLTLQYDSGVVRTFTGTMSDPNHLTGTFSDTTGTVMFIRR